MLKNKKKEFVRQYLDPFLKEYGFTYYDDPQGVLFVKQINAGAISFVIQIESSGAFTFGAMNVMIKAIEDFLMPLFRKYGVNQPPFYLSTVTFQDTEANSKFYELRQLKETDEKIMEVFKEAFTNVSYPTALRLCDLKEAWLSIKQQWLEKGSYSSVSSSGITKVLRLLSIAKLCNENELYEVWLNKNKQNEALMRSHPKGREFFDEGIALLNGLQPVVNLGHN